MTNLWDIDGENLDLAYVNLREAKFAVEREMRSALDAMWATYESYADSDFRTGFARDPEGRFWEMYVGCRLINAGRTLLPAAERKHEGGKPDICVLDGDRRIWIEAICPDEGDPGPDQVRGPVPVNHGGGFEPSPTRQAQLRMTSALWTKSQVVERYLSTGVIGAGDVRLIAIGAGRFGAYVTEYPLPLIMPSVFPIGDVFVSINTDTGEVVDRGFHPSFEITRAVGSIPRTAFIDGTFAHISGILWSRSSISNLRHEQRPLTLVHNPRATIPMAKAWGVWDREFVTTEHHDHWLAKDILAPDPT